MAEAGPPPASPPAVREAPPAPAQPVLPPKRTAADIRPLPCPVDGTPGRVICTGSRTKEICDAAWAIIRNNYKKYNDELSGGIAVRRALRKARSFAISAAMGLSIGLLAVAFSPCRVDAAGTSALKTTPVRLFSRNNHRRRPPVAILGGPQIKRADFEQAQKSPNARRVADWVVTSGDNGGLPFAIVDKLDARVFVSTPTGGFAVQPGSCWESRGVTSPTPA